MIVTEIFTIRNDGVELYRTYSDQGYKIIQNDTGIVYDEAVDVKNSGHTYSETDEKVEILEEMPV